MKVKIDRLNVDMCDVAFSESDDDEEKKNKKLIKYILEELLIDP